MNLILWVNQIDVFKEYLTVSPQKTCSANEKSMRIFCKNGFRLFLVEYLKAKQPLTAYYTNESLEIKEQNEYLFRIPLDNNPVLMVVHHWKIPEYRVEFKLNDTSPKPKLLNKDLQGSWETVSYEYPCLSVTSSGTEAIFKILQLFFNDQAAILNAQLFHISR